MKFALFICLAALVLAVNGQQQRCRETPPMWKGFFYENNYVAEGRDPYARFATVEYDAGTTGKEMVRIIEFDELLEPGRINGFKQLELYLFGEKEGYIYNYNTRQCRKEPIREGFHPFGVLEVSKFTGIRRLGLATGDKLGLSVDHFYYSREGEDSLNHHYSSYWVPLPSSESVCVPVEQHFISLNGRGPSRTPSFDARYTFLNITTVTEFPSTTFEVPSACRT